MQASGDPSPFYGMWRLVGVDRQRVGSGEVLDHGVEQNGYICYGDGSRVMVVINRIAPGQPVSVIAYAGTWVVEGNTVFHDVEISTREAWTGTRQIRNFRFEGNRLILSPPESLDLNHNDVTRRSLTWEKI